MKKAMGQPRNQKMRNQRMPQRMPGHRPPLPLPSPAPSPTPSPSPMVEIGGASASQEWRDLWTERENGKKMSLAIDTGSDQWCFVASLALRAVKRERENSESVAFSWHRFSALASRAWIAVKRENGDSVAVLTQSNRMLPIRNALASRGVETCQQKEKTVKLTLLFKWSLVQVIDALSSRAWKSGNRNGESVLSIQTNLIVYSSGAMIPSTRKKCRVLLIETIFLQQRGIVSTERRRKKEVSRSPDRNQVHDETLNLYLICTLWAFESKNLRYYYGF